MTNTRRAVLALSLGVLLLLAVGILLQVHFWRMIILLGLFFFAEVFIIWYSGSKSKSQNSGGQSLEFFWLENLLCHNCVSRNSFRFSVFQSCFRFVFCA